MLQLEYIGDQVKKYVNFRRDHFLNLEKGQSWNIKQVHKLLLQSYFPKVSIYIWEFFKPGSNFLKMLLTLKTSCTKVDKIYSFNLCNVWHLIFQICAFHYREENRVQVYKVILLPSFQLEFLNESYYDNHYWELQTFLYSGLYWK